MSLNKKIKRFSMIIQSKFRKNSVSWLRKCGATIGDDVHLTANCTCSPVDATCLSIGNHVTLVGVHILTHDASPQIFIGKGCVRLGRVEIENNVFVGLNSIILPNVHIGNNVIIGAGSVVTHNIPDNCVVAGNPAHVIDSIEHFIKKTDDLLKIEDNVIHDLNREGMTKIERMKLNNRLKSGCIYYLDR